MLRLEWNAVKAPGATETGDYKEASLAFTARSTPHFATVLRHLYEYHWLSSSAPFDHPNLYTDFWSSTEASQGPGEAGKVAGTTGQPESTSPTSAHRDMNPETPCPQLQEDRWTQWIRVSLQLLHKVPHRNQRVHPKALKHLILIKSASSPILVHVPWSPLYFYILI